MRKIVIIGGGSFNFSRSLVRDILSYPALSDSEIALVDIPEGLKYLQASERIIGRIIEEAKYPASIRSTLDRREALKGADAVIITIRNDTSVEQWEKDLSIPKKYGVDVVIGDTRGPSGIFRFLRSAPAFNAIARDILDLCPGAVVLNYSNPMCMVTDYLRRLGVGVVGLCHSVQGTASMLAGWIGADMKDVTYTCAGINHQAFYLEYKVKGKDAYPMIRAAAEDPERYKAEAVRIEMLKALGYFVTESSGHNSEYNAWFRKRQDLIDRYVPGSYAQSVRIITERTRTRDAEMERILMQDHVGTERGAEYASGILNAVIGDGMLFEFNGNVPNTGLIPNLPENAIVEVPVSVSKHGIRPVYVGSLPRHLAALNTVNAQCEALAVDALTEKDREAVFHAVLNDPLTAAVCSLAEIRAMTDEMFEANREKLPIFF